MLHAQSSAGAPHVLVLLATYNGAPWLEAMLRSIVGQQEVRVSILANDDQSTDGTPALLQQWANETSTELELLPASPRRLGAAANFFKLVREARFDTFDAVALADQDDIWDPNRLARALASIRDERLAAYSSDVEAFWSNGRRRRLSKAGRQRRFDYFFEPAGPGCTYVLSAGFASRLQTELRSEPQRFESIGYHDWLIYAYARSHGERWKIDPHPGVAYRQHGANELGANHGLSAVTKRWHRLTSGWFRAQVLHIAQLWPTDGDDVLFRLKRLRMRDRLWLAMHARSLRRRPRDQLALALMLILGVLR